MLVVADHRITSNLEPFSSEFSADPFRYYAELRRVPGLRGLAKLPLALHSA